MTIISSQRYLNDEIVEAKRAAKDYAVAISPAFEIDGETYQVVLDGHHSLEAARMDGVGPEFTEQTPRENDNVQILLDGNTEDFLVRVRVDSDYYDIATGRDVW